MSKLYDNPKYYEIAFSFREIYHEVDVFEEAIKKFSRIPVKRVLEIGCGNSPHLEELIKRGYEYIGIDLSKAMIRYSQKKASTIRGSAKFVCANMVDFSLNTKVDFAYILLGSLYVKNTKELISHFNSVSQVLKKGGLYFLDGCIQFTPSTRYSESWEIEHKGIKVKTTYSTQIVNSLEKTFEEVILLNVNDKGKTKKIVERTIKHSIYPQEFLFFIANRKDFEFIGFWNNWNLSQPLQGTNRISRPIAIVRKT